MTVEDHISEVLTTGLAARFPGRDVPDWWFASSSLGLGENEPVPERPYIVWNEGPEFVHQAVRETSSAMNRAFRFYVYDYKGDFTRINEILDAIRDIIKTMAPFDTDDGIRCSEAVWNGKSARAVDDGYDSCVRYGSALFTVSR